MRARGGPYRAANVAEACKGSIISGDPAEFFQEITTDSRDIKVGDLFVPIKGDKFDGHEFIFPALEAGARGSLTSGDAHRENPQFSSKHILIQVQDTYLALSDLASAHRTLHHVPLIAVTGSSGKTTVKEMIASILRRSHNSLVSEGNYNNTIGLPMTILNLTSSHSAAVVEAGINKPGEMKFLARAARPDVAVITNIGPVHLEGLGSQERVAEEKFQLASCLQDEGTVIVPANDRYLQPLVASFKGNVTTFGISEGDVRAVIKSYGEVSEISIFAKDFDVSITLHISGLHNVANAACAAAAASAIGVSPEDIEVGLTGFRAPKWRMEILELGQKRLLIRDCYNANPLSMKAALKVLSEKNSSPTLAILGDMMELGDSAEELHRGVGYYAASLGISKLVLVGKFAPFTRQGYLEGGGKIEQVGCFQTKEEAWDYVVNEIRSYGTILVKGSRSMQMELIAEKISEEN